MTFAGLAHNTTTEGAAMHLSSLTSTKHNTKLPKIVRHGVRQLLARDRAAANASRQSEAAERKSIYYTSFQQQFNTIHSRAIQYPAWKFLAPPECSVEVDFSRQNCSTIAALTHLALLLECTTKNETLACKGFRDVRSLADGLAGL